MTSAILPQVSLKIVNRKTDAINLFARPKLRTTALKWEGTEINCTSTTGTKLGSSIECFAAAPFRRSTTPVHAGLFSSC